MRPYVLHWLTHHMRADVAGLLAPSWFTCVGLAGLAALVAMLVLARRRGLDPGTVASAVLWCYVAAVIAGIAVPAAITAVEHLIATGRFQLRWSGMNRRRTGRRIRPTDGALPRDQTGPRQGDHAGDVTVFSQNRGTH